MIHRPVATFQHKIVGNFTGSYGVSMAAATSASVINIYVVVESTRTHVGTMNIASGATNWTFTRIVADNYVVAAGSVWEFTAQTTGALSVSSVVFGPVTSVT